MGKPQALDNPPVAHHPVSFPRNLGAQYRKLSVAGVVSLRTGRGGWIRTTDRRNQNPMPYRLATPLNIRKELTPLWRSDSLR